MAYKGVTNIYVPEQLTQGAVFISHKQTITSRETRKPVAERFEIYLPNYGVVEMTCDLPMKNNARPKFKTPIKVIEPHFVVSGRARGSRENRQARLNYALHANDFEIME